MIDHLRLQLEQAAKGCVSGTLAEWPHLDSALRHSGITLPKSAPPTVMRRAAVVALAKCDVEDAQVRMR
jgi:hypothetical protein